MTDFETWYVREHPRLVRAMTVLYGEAGPDLAAEACARCLERWESPNPVADPTAWTFRVAVNVARSRARRRRLERDRLHRAGPSEVVAGPSEPDLELWEAIRALPPRQRTAIVLRYAAGLSEAQTAAVMGIATGTVGATTAAARRRLAEALGPDPRSAGDDDTEPEEVDRVP